MTSLPTSVVVNLCSLLILAYVLFSLWRWSAAMSGHKKALILLTAVVFAIIAATAVREVPSFPDSVRGAAAFLSFAFSPFLLFAWMLYGAAWMDIERRTARKWLWAPAMFCLFNILLVLILQLSGWEVYYFTAEGTLGVAIGKGFYAELAAVLLDAFYIEGFLIHYRKKINTVIRRQLMCFVLFPFVFAFFTVISGNAVTVPDSFAYGILYLYLFVESRDAGIDYLTGLWNRRELDLRIDAKMRDITRAHSFGTLMMDIDHFKQINDTYGHDMGDAALVGVADILAKCFRQDDTVARYGGDEFYVVTDVDDETLLEEAADRVRARIEEFNGTKTLPCRIELSIGCAVCGENMTAKELLKEVDGRMYREKREKKNKAPQPEDAARSPS